MFAVIKIAGQQFKVQPGQNLYVPHLSGKSGDKDGITLFVVPAMYMALAKDHSGERASRPAGELGTAQGSSA